MLFDPRGTPTGHSRACAAPTRTYDFARLDGHCVCVTLWKQLLDDHDQHCCDHRPSPSRTRDCTPVHINTIPTAPPTSPTQPTPRGSSPPGHPHPDRPGPTGGAGTASRRPLPAGATPQPPPVGAANDPRDRRSPSHPRRPHGAPGKPAHRVAAAARMHPSPLVVAMDGDTAGQDSNRRLATALAAAGRAVLVTRLPVGEDPASWLAVHGPRRLTEFLSGARQLITGPDRRHGASHGLDVGLT